MLKLKKISSTATTVKEGMELAGYWPIQVRVWTLNDVVIHPDGSFTVKPGKTQERPAIEPSREDLDKLLPKEANEELHYVPAPARTALTKEDIINYLNSSDDLAARSEVGPWKTGKTSGKAAKLVQRLTDENDSMNKVMKVMEYVMELSRDGKRHPFWDLSGQERVKAAPEILNSPEYLAWCESK